VLIIGWSKLYYEATGIVTLYMWPSRAQVKRGLCTGRPPTECDDTRRCIIQFEPADDEHIVLETRRGINKLILKQDFVH